MPTLTELSRQISNAIRHDVHNRYGLPEELVPRVTWRTSEGKTEIVSEVSESPSIFQAPIKCPREFNISLHELQQQLGRQPRIQDVTRESIQVVMSHMGTLNKEAEIEQIYTEVLPKISLST